MSSATVTPIKNTLPVAVTLDCQHRAETGAQFYKVDSDNGVVKWTETACRPCAAALPVDQETINRMMSDDPRLAG